MDTFLGVPRIRIIVCWGLYWGPPILGNYHIFGIAILAHPFPGQVLRTVSAKLTV